MKKTSTLEKKDFDALLNWLSADREKAGEKYEQVRTGLIKFFRFNGCGDADGLADETINRVAAKLKTFDNSKNVKTITYFYGFAANILREYKREEKKETPHTDLLLLKHEIEPNLENELDNKTDCLRECLNKFSAEERKILLNYYGAEKNKKIEVRKQLAKYLNCEPNALHVRIFRLRNALKICIEKCVEKKL